MAEASGAIANGANEKAEELEPEPPTDAAPVLKIGQRDGAIALAALSLFAAADAWYITTGLGFAALLAALDGAVVGYVVAKAETLASTPV